MLDDGVRRKVTFSKEICLVAYAVPQSDVSSADPILRGLYGGFRLSIPAYRIRARGDHVHVCDERSERHVQRSNRVETQSNRDSHGIELAEILGS